MAFKLQSLISVHVFKLITSTVLLIFFTPTVWASATTHREAIRSCAEQLVTFPFPGSEKARTVQADKKFLTVNEIYDRIRQKAQSEIEYLEHASAEAYIGLAWDRQGNTTRSPILYKDGTIASRVGFDQVEVMSPDGRVQDYYRSDRKFQEYEIPKKEIFFDGSLKGRKVLDVGCGGGSAVRDLRQLGIDAHGVDIILDPGPFLHQAQAKHTGLANEEFDVIFSYFSFFSYELTGVGKAGDENGLLAMQELNRILAPGGLILLGEVEPQKIKQIVSRIPGLSIVQPNRLRNWRSSFSKGKNTPIKQVIIRKQIRS